MVRVRKGLEFGLKYALPQSWLFILKNDKLGVTSSHIAAMDALFTTNTQ